MPNTLDAEQEQALVTAAQGDAQHFRALYGHYFPRVYGYIASRVHQTQDAEDLTAEAFLKVVESLHRFEYRGAGSFTAWMFRVARSTVQDFYRRRGNLEHVPLDDLPDLPHDAEPPDEVLAQQQIAVQMRSLVKMLPPRQQEMIVLRYFAGLRNREIADVLSLDERTIAAHLSRGLATLRDAAEVLKEVSADAE